MKELILMHEGPGRFGWILLDELSGSARPGRFGPLEEDLAFLRSKGIGVIISLLETTLNLEKYREEGFETHHFPVEDFTAPELEQIAAACAVLDEATTMGKKILVHCNAGIGRTGTLLAAYLLHRGVTADEAIRRVRRERPLSLETSEQVDMIHRYYRSRQSPMR